MAITTFGIQFAEKVYRRTWQDAVIPAVANQNYQGDIEKPGDRVRILNFLSGGVGGVLDYTSGTDMGTEVLFDNSADLVINQQKYWNFAIDRTEDIFTFVGDAADALVQDRSENLARIIDRDGLRYAYLASAMVGINLRVVGSSRDTEASIATTATGGTITLSTQTATSEGTDPTENPADGTNYLAGLTSVDTGKLIRLTSGQGAATDWYRITTVTDTATASVENVDGATSGADIPNGDILRGLFAISDPEGNRYSTPNGDGKPTTEGGYGWEIAAAATTAITSTNIYAHIVLCGEQLDKREVPSTNRHLVIPPEGKTALVQASQLIPAVAMAYEGVVLNGKVATVNGFDIHEAAGARLSSQAGHSTVTSGTGSDSVVATGSTGYLMLANHINFLTFAYKWAESRVVDAESQFAKKYQGLHLYGFQVPQNARRFGVVLFGSF